MLKNHSLESRERKARKKGLDAGYRVSKGFQHYHNGGIVSNWNRLPHEPYAVIWIKEEGRGLRRGFSKKQE